MINWRGVVGYEDYYKISPDGQVYSVRSGKLLATPPNKYRGYKEFCIRINGWRKTAQVHQEVAKAYLGPANGRHVRHLNGDPLDNRVENLKYGTPKENQGDRRSEDYQGSRLLTHDQITEIKTRSGQGERTETLAADFGVSYSVINNLLEKNQTEVTKERLWQCIKTGAGISVIADFLGVTHGAVSTMLKRHFKPMRQIRREVPLNKSLTVDDLARLVND